MASIPADISITARYTAAAWAALELPFAERFVDWRGRAMFRASRLGARFVPGRFGHLLMDGILTPRHLYMDDWVRHHKIEQVIEIASGFSPRGLMFANEGVHYIEVDRPNVIGEKRRLCANDSPRPEFVGADVTSGNMVERVTAACRPGLRTAILNEGMAPYFSREAYLPALANIRKLALATQATLVTDFYRAPARFSPLAALTRLSSHALRTIADRVYLYVRNEAELRALFSDSGWQVESIATPAENARYLRGRRPAQANWVYVVAAKPA